MGPIDLGRKLKLAFLISSKFKLALNLKYLQTGTLLSVRLRPHTQPWQGRTPHLLPQRLLRLQKQGVSCELSMFGQIRAEVGVHKQ